MLEKNPGLENIDEVARDVGVGAIVFNALSSGRIKDIVFSWDRALNFDGETGPYCQYTHARCCSVLQKAGWQPGQEVDYSVLTDAASLEVVRLLGEFPDAVHAACEKNEPYMVTRHVVDLCQAYNKFYLENRILGEAPGVQYARLALTEAARTVIATGLNLIGVAAPKRM